MKIALRHEKYTAAYLTPPPFFVFEKAMQHENEREKKRKYRKSLPCFVKDSYSLYKLKESNHYVIN